MLSPLATDDEKSAAARLSGCCLARRAGGDHSIPACGTWSIRDGPGRWVRASSAIRRHSSPARHLGLDRPLLRRPGSLAPHRPGGAALFPVLPPVRFPSGLLARWQHDPRYVVVHLTELAAR